ncbi:UV-damaged DNA binding protein [Aspergillus luchuensis]|uniref:UV-damaged DNA binding protein n=1 Tax=Aspergillus kawachii TaxID=1069201 RepID=A0A146F1Y6_ASPKA|nr:UV-damaged DNA binding protein [Aspergillus luchuensis]
MPNRHACNKGRIVSPMWITRSRYIQTRQIALRVEWRRDTRQNAAQMNDGSRPMHQVNRIQSQDKALTPQGSTAEIDQS